MTKFDTFLEWTFRLLERRDVQAISFGTIMCVLTILGVRG